MPRAFMMRLDKIQPSQLYISSKKLSKVMKTFNPNSMRPIPIRDLKATSFSWTVIPELSLLFYTGLKKFQYIGNMKNWTGKSTKFVRNDARRRESVQ